MNGMNESVIHKKTKSKEKKDLCDNNNEYNGIKKGSIDSLLQK